MALGEALLGGIGSIVSGLFGKSSAEKQQRQQIQLQKDFAQKGIQWKVKDAEKAGVHPLAALGANTIAYSPVTVGTPDLGLGQMGQDIGRAIDAGSTANQRTASLQTRIAEAQLKGLELDNAGKAIQNTALASQSIRNAQVGPPMAAVSGETNTGMAGQGTSKLIYAGERLPGTPEYSTADQGETTFGEAAGELFGISKLAATWDKMPTAQKWKIAQSVLGPAFVVKQTPNWWKYATSGGRRSPANYGPRVTTKSFKNTFQ